MPLSRPPSSLHELRKTDQERALLSDSWRLFAGITVSRRNLASSLRIQKFNRLAGSGRYLASATLLNARDERLEKRGPGLSHERSCAFQLLTSFGFLIAGCGSEQQARANDTGDAFGDPGMTLGRNLDCLFSSGEGSRTFAIKSVGICQVGQNTRFVFKASLSRSGEAESVR